MAVALLFMLATFATPLHLVTDVHEWGPRESGTPDVHDHSHHEPHPSTDHQVDPASPVARPVPVVVEMVALDIPLTVPDVRNWSPSVEAEANSPPSAPVSPPRSPRAPPL